MNIVLHITNYTLCNECVMVLMAITRQYSFILFRTYKFSLPQFIYEYI
jgi:hypothetical protein